MLAESLQRVRRLRRVGNEAIRDLQPTRRGAIYVGRERVVLLHSQLMHFQPMYAPKPPPFPFDQLGVLFSNCYGSPRQDPKKDMMVLKQILKGFGGWPSAGWYDENTPQGGAWSLAVRLRSVVVHDLHYS